MKKYLLTLTLFIGSFVPVAAQRAKGSWMLGTSVLTADRNVERSINPTSETGDFKNFDLTVTPRAGKFVSDKLAVGAGLRFSYAYTNYEGDPLLTQSLYHKQEIGLQPFARYYFTAASRSALFAEAAISAGASFEKNEFTMKHNGSTPATRYTTHSLNKTNKAALELSVSVAVGYTIMLNRVIGLDLTIGLEQNGGKKGTGNTAVTKTYESGSVVKENSVSTTSPNKTTAVQLGAGLMIFLGKSK